MENLEREGDGRERKRIEEEVKKGFG